MSTLKKLGMVFACLVLTVILASFFGGTGMDAVILFCVLCLSCNLNK